jgi:hypothetical protein
MGFTMIIGWNMPDGSSEAAYIDGIMKQIEQQRRKRKKRRKK